MQSVGDTIVSKNTTETHENYLFNCSYSKGLKLIDALSFDFFDSKEINYQSPFSIKSTWGNGAVLYVMCQGAKIFRNEELLLETDYFEKKVTIIYPITYFIDKAVHPMLLTNSLAYSTSPEIIFNDKNDYTFVINVYSPEVCFNDTCVIRPAGMFLWSVIIQNFNWETEKGDLKGWPKDFASLMFGAQKDNVQIISGEYTTNLGFREIPDDLKNNISWESTYISKVNTGFEFQQPLLLRTLDVFASLTSLTYHTLKIAGNDVIMSGHFTRGIILGNDTVWSKTGGDPFFVKIPLEKIIVSIPPNDNKVNAVLSIYPNPATEYLDIKLPENLVKGQYVWLLAICSG